jgi:hypothetical protein
MNTAYNYLDLEPKAGMKVVTDNSGSGTPTGTSIEDSERSPQIIPGQKSASRKLASISPKPISGQLPDRQQLGG